MVSVGRVVWPGQHVVKQEAGPAWPRCGLPGLGRAEGDSTVMSFPTAALLHCRAPGQINSLVWLHRVVAAVAAQLDLNGKLILGMPNSEHLKMMNKAISVWHKRRVATCLCCMTRSLVVEVGWQRLEARGDGHSERGLHAEAEAGERRWA